MKCIFGLIWALVFLVTISKGYSQTSVVVIPLGEDPSPRQNMITGNGTWNCTLGQSCQDVYEFSIDEPGSAIVKVDSISGGSALRMALYAPGQNLGETNLLTNNSSEVECLSQNTRFEDTISLAAAGIYKLAVTRDWGSSAGFNGAYSLTLATSVPRTDIGQVIDDESSMAAGSINTPCSDENLTSGPGSWICQLGESCQDVFTFSIGEPGSATIDINSVTGSSVLRLALYGPNASLGGLNILTGNTSDLECAGQNTDFNGTVSLSTAGVYQLAIGRDWGSSAGFNGSYDLQFYTSVPRTDLGQTVNDVNTLTSGSVAGSLCL